MAIVYNKLVRDKIPQIITQDGKTAATHVADDAEYREKLLEKLQEEVAEYIKSGNPEELADVLEVVHALAALSSQTPDQLEQVRAAKAAARGGFTKRIILEETS